MPAKTFHELVDLNGPHRPQMLKAFRFIEEFEDLSDAELQAKCWPVLRAWIGDVLGRYRCPNCNGRGELDPGTGRAGWIECPTCEGEGYGYDSRITGRALLVHDPALPGPAPTGPKDAEVAWAERPWPDRDDPKSRRVR
jgi:hypothetical protein